MSAQQNANKFKREFTKEQLDGKHHIRIIPKELNAMFLRECEKERRIPADMIRIMMEDRYSAEIHYPKSVDVKPHAEPQRKREVI